jgi:hypothetical protein
MCTRQLLISLAAASIMSAPASASALIAGTKGAVFTALDTSTQGTMLVGKSEASQGLTFAGIISLAVYRNTFGNLDFYYQYERTGAGTNDSDAIETITGSNFAGYSVDAFYSDADVDGSGFFKASTNNGAPATAQRNLSGSVVGIDFASSNPLADHEVSSTYVFRTDAKVFLPGTFGVIDGSTVAGVGYRPAASPVPEASTWAMMLLGFGGIGTMMRASRTRRATKPMPDYGNVGDRI